MQYSPRKKKKEKEKKSWVNGKLYQTSQETIGKGLGPPLFTPP
jgi:hypothetical protein